jgi:methionine synthase I (cobalamin-dependent)
MLYEAGADVVGLNCGRGPTTMIPLVKDIRKTYKVTYVQIIIVLKYTWDKVNNIKY